MGSLSIKLIICMQPDMARNGITCRQWRSYLPALLHSVGKISSLYRLREGSDASQGLTQALVSYSTMALRSGLTKWRQGLQLAAVAAAGSMTYAICESDARAPSFDPEALERGAKALREINASPNAKKVMTCADRSGRLSSGWI